MNAFQVEEKMELERLKVDPTIEHAQCLRLAQLRSRRDAARTHELMAHLETAARGAGKLDALVRGGRAGVRHPGREICGVLRSVFGEYQPPVML